MIVSHLNEFDSFAVCSELCALCVSLTHTHSDTHFLQTLGQECSLSLEFVARGEAEERKVCVRVCVRVPCNDWAEVFTAE